MSPTLTIIVAIVFFLHGLGHLLGGLPIFGIRLSKKHSADSWLLTKFLGKMPSNFILAIFFDAALLAFVFAGFALMGWIFPPGSWMIWAKFAAKISIIGLVLFWNAYPFLFPNKIGVIVVDVGTLVLVAIME